MYLVSAMSAGSPSAFIPPPADAPASAYFVTVRFTVSNSNATAVPRAMCVLEWVLASGQTAPADTAALNLPGASGIIHPVATGYLQAAVKEKPMFAVVDCGFAAGLSVEDVNVSFTPVMTASGAQF